ncbi:MAG: hypothetical protein JNM94_15010 [Phycisphaerae bacterium]|nr:hypothetical protein [Phycisphaerae bacterium]
MTTRTSRPRSDRSILTPRLALAALLAATAAAGSLPAAHAFAAPPARTSAVNRPEARPPALPERVDTDAALGVGDSPYDLDVLDPTVSRLSAAAVSALQRGDIFAVPNARGELVRLRVAGVSTSLLGTRIVRLVGDPAIGSTSFADATLTTDGTLVGGAVRMRDGFEVRLAAVAPDEQDLVVRPEGLGDCMSCSSGDKARVDGGGVASDCQESAKFVDVAFVVSQDAIGVWGSLSALTLQLETSVDDANLALSNSGLLTQLRLVGIDEYTTGIETGGFSSMGDMFNVIANGVTPSNGNEAAARTFTYQARENLQADLVQMIVAFPSPGACGIGELFDGDPESAYSIVDASCLGDYVPAHEFGHNFGACHAVGDGGGCDSGGYYAFSNGYRFTGTSGQVWRTIMAYAPGSRIPYFSTPKKSFDGKAVGVGGSTSAAADNARTLGLTGISVANFRCSIVDALDCNNNGEADSIDIATATSDDCNGNGIPDECDISSGFLADTNNNGVPDLCEGGAAFKIVSPDLAGQPVALDLFGSAMSIGRRLDTPVDVGGFLVVGAYGDDQIASNAGAAYILEPISSGGTITKLAAADGTANAQFGRSVSGFRRIAQTTPAAPERLFAVAGAYRAKVGNNAEQGAAYVFSKSGATWVQSLKAVASDGGASDWFGFATHMTRIGLDTFDTLVVGAPRASGGKGAVYVYRYNANDTTTLSKKLIVPLAGEGDDFGWSVALDPSVDGNRAILVAGQPGYGLDSGRVRVYERALAAGVGFPSAGQTIVQPGVEASPNDRFGEAVAITDNTLVIGAPGKNGGQGAAYYFERTAATVWTFRQKITLPSPKVDDGFGSTVALWTTDTGAVLLSVAAPKGDAVTPAGSQANLGVIATYLLNTSTDTFELINLGVTADGQSGDEAGTSLLMHQTAPGVVRTLIGSPFDDDGGLNAGSITSIGSN